MSGIAFAWTSGIFIACAALILLRLVLGKTSADRLTALSVISALVLGLLVMYGVTNGKAVYLDVALIYDIFGFLGILAIATFTRDRTANQPTPSDTPDDGDGSRNAADGKGGT